jgi:hypothetical protein
MHRVAFSAQDVFVLFYQPGAPFCKVNGSAYGEFADGISDTPSVLATHMDVITHKSPFVFEEAELPVAMLFPAQDKRPLEYDQAFDAQKLRAFLAEHTGSAGGKKQEL